jgi:hypothetical protein
MDKKEVPYIRVDGGHASPQSIHYEYSADEFAILIGALLFLVFVWWMFFGFKWPRK